MRINSYVLGVAVGLILAWYTAMAIDQYFYQEAELSYKRVNSLSWEQEGKIVIH